MRPPLAPVFITLVLLAPALPAHADGRMTFLSRQLGKAKDPRARAQAALMIGASQEEGLTSPLCEALGDDSPVVRSAAAHALLQLEDAAGLTCISAREPREQDSDVKRELARSREGLAALRDRKPLLYIALHPMADTTGGLGAEVLQLAEARLRAKLAHLPILLAPVNEPRAQAKAKMKQKHLRGFQLRPALTGLAGGGIKLNILCLSYPEQAVLGEVDVNASGAQPADLVRALVPRAVDEAAQTFDWIR